MATALRFLLRAGWDDDNRNAKEVVHIAANEGVTWVAIHGRTRAQGYQGLADWEFIRNISIQSPIPIIGNGDILTAEQAKSRIENGYSHAVMIGRGALKNPWIFREILGIQEEKNFVSLVTRHFEIAEQKKHTQGAFLSLKKFLARYATGYSGASAFRASIFKTNDLKELKSLALGYFEGLKPIEWKEDTTPFLMGGHG